MQKPTIGRIVIYNTTAKEREAMEKNSTLRHGQGCNAQKQLPAVVVAVWGHQLDSAINIKVMMDGAVPDMWITSIKQGDGEGQWNWPVIIGAKDKPATTEGTTGSETNSQA